jgi:uncharacterized membrane protein YccF (DUF307 family)
MTVLLNVLWVVLGGGFIIALEYALVGVVLCLTVVGIPFGLQCFKMAGLGLWPFGRDLDVTPAGGAMRTLFNVLWFVLAGVWIFISHLVLAAGLAVTIIGIPFAYQHLKFAVLALAPFGRTVR